MMGYDVIGDIHGCAVEFRALLDELGYVGYSHPRGRKVILVGDLTDRGPDSLGVLRMAMALQREGHLVVRGNHDDKLYRWTIGNPVKIKAGMSTTVSELEQLGVNTSEFVEISNFLRELPYVASANIGWRELIVTHAGIPFDYLSSSLPVSLGEFKRHCVYGEVAGFHEDGLPIRTFEFYKTWRNRKYFYQVHGHTKIAEPDLHGPHNVLNIDTGCVSGGSLTAYRFPEHELVQVPALQVYHESKSGTGATTEELVAAREQLTG